MADLTENLKKLGADDGIMVLNSVRMKSFKHWPFSEEDKCTPQKMADAGFYACGGSKEPDLARCYVCRKELDGWESTDDPWEEHKRRGKCAFINLAKKPEDITIKDAMNLETEKMANLQQKILVLRSEQYEEKSKKVIESFNKLMAAK